MPSATRVLAVIGLAACSNGSQGGAADRGTERPVAGRAAVDAAVERESQPESPCSSDADCAVVQKGEDCCDICGWRALTKQGLAALERQCAGRTPACPPIDCPFQARHAACVGGRCAAVPDGQPAPAVAPDAGACRPVRDDERAAILAAERFLGGGGVLRGSPAPPSRPAPQRGGIVLEEVYVERESLEAHAWGVVRPRTATGAGATVPARRTNSADATERARADSDPPRRGLRLSERHTAEDGLRLSEGVASTGSARGESPSQGTTGRFLVVFRYDADWLTRVFPRERVAAEQARAGQAVEVGSGRPPSRIHQDILLDHVEHVCPAP